MAPADPSSSASAPSGGKRLLIGCLAGCGGLALLAVSCCVALVVWVNRPGELLQPSALRGPDTTVYLEWTLRLEDPGTQQFVEQLFATIRRMQERAPTPLPPGVDRLLGDLQTRRNEKQIRELFPCVAAWSVARAPDGADELHLLTLSVEKLGNRMVLVDWLLDLVLRRSHEVEVVEHGGERIYRLDRDGAAFFLRRSDFFFTTDVEAARQTVDRLAAAAAEAAPRETALDRMIEALPPDRPLRGAALNGHDEARRFLGRLAGDEAALAALPWAGVRGMTLAGGFTGASAFEAVLELELSGEGWTEDEARALSAALGDALGAGRPGVRLETERRARAVRLRFGIDDLPGLLQERLANL